MNLGFFEVGLNIRDIGRSLAFYRTLGFDIVNGSVEIRTVTLCKGDCRIALYPRFGEDMLYLQYYQGDVEAIERHLANKGMRFEWSKKGSTGVSVGVKDPDGHLLNFIKQPERFRPDRRTHKDQITGVDFGWFEASLPVEDMARALAFYGQLGFQQVEGGVATNATLQSGDCRLGLFQGHLDPPRPQLIFWQGDVEAIAENLTAKGLHFDKAPRRDADGVGAMLMDPDGHPLYFVNMSGPGS